MPLLSSALVLPGTHGSLRRALRLQGGSSPIASALQLEANTLRLAATGQPILDGVSACVKSGADDTTASGGLFLHIRPEDDAALPERLVSLGQLRCSRLLAAARVTRYWMGPAFGTRASDVPLDTQFMLLELAPDGPYALLLPLIDERVRATLHGDDGRGRRGSDELWLHAESGDAAVGTAAMRALYVAAGDEPFALLRRGFAEVAAELGSFAPLSAKALPPTVDDFGWCTWDAFYSEVTPAGVVEGLRSLRDAGTPARTLILDDGWQSVAPTKQPAGAEQPAEQPQHVSPQTQGLFGAARRGAARGAAWAAALLLGVVAKVVEAFYEACVRKAPHGSVAARVWRLLAHTVLKAQLASYFEDETDFARQLDSFAPNAKFEAAGGEDAGGASLAALVARVKGGEFGVRRVLCWHALHGYWRGASDALGAASGVEIEQHTPTPSTHLLSIEPQVAWDTPALFGVGIVPARDPPRAAAQLRRFYDGLHAPLAAAGVDGVKIDVQSGVGALGGGGAGGGVALAGAYTRAMEASVGRRFAPNGADLHCINCMCHSTENLYNYKTTSVARASDDFYPRRPHSHTVHLVNVAYNSLFLGEVCLPDWDMFHSRHEVAALHAAARAVSGGPVYVSDAPGQHDAALLRRLVLRDGTTLRAKRPGRPTRDCLFTDVGADGVSALKVWNTNGAAWGGGVVGAFHVQGVAWSWRTHTNEVVQPAPPPVVARVCAADVDDLRDADGPLVCWLHRAARLVRLPSARHVVETTLAHREWEIFTLARVQQQQQQQQGPGGAEEGGGGGVSWAPIGLVEMLNSGGAVVSSTLEASAPGPPRALLVTRGAGRFVAHCQPAPAQVLLDGTTPLPFEHSGDELGELSFELPGGAANASVSVVWAA